ncbi:MAG: histidine kinase [Thermodesulfobacteriota bacterium]|nr:histidine kinase [Thermodesulfobacteriota bacterium]
MEHKPLPQDTGLAFYSKVSASISHELKNALAVINESAGFLEDVVLMVQKGIPLDSGRLSTLAGTVLKQVQRSNTIIKNMNRLAHSLDEKQAVVDLGSLLELMLHVSERNAVSRGVKITGTFPEVPVSITTHPFFLETLVWLLLELSMETCGDARTVTVAVTGTGAGAGMIFSGLGALTGAGADAFLAGRSVPLLEALGADLKIFEGEGRLVLTLPTVFPGDK